MKACCCCGTIHPKLARKCQGPCGVTQSHWRPLTEAETAELAARKARVQDIFDRLLRGEF